MPAVPSGKVLVTGASGFIAVWVVKKLLKAGYAVKGTVRSAPKGEYLKRQFGNYGDLFEYCIVEDIAKDGAFDEAVKGVDAVEHTASPFHFRADDPKEVIDPAVNGTLGILKSAEKYGTSVKRIVITASVASVVNALNPGPLTEPLVITEKDWNVSSTRAVEKDGRSASASDKYCASKTLAEKAARDFVDSRKGSLGWDIVTIHPPFVFGPILHEVSSVENLNTSVNHFYQLIKNGSQMSAEELTRPATSWVDVRDVAQAHLSAIQIDAAGGKRFITSTGEFTVQDIFDALSSTGLPDIPKGVFGSGKNANHTIIIDSSAAKQVLGIKFTDLETSTKDMLLELRKRGW